jgi:hypothetical protein
MKKALLVFLISMTLYASRALAQAEGSEYQTAIGIKFYPTALSVKHFIAGDRAVEGLAYFYNYGFRITGLYEFHGDIHGLEGLKWYAGPGAHIGFWNNAWARRYDNRKAGIALGIDGVLGLDYKISGIPINLSIDWQPSFNIISYTTFEPGWGGLGIRYTIK